jgi:ankyrin repeat protein
MTDWKRVLEIGDLDIVRATFNPTNVNALRAYGDMTVLSYACAECVKDNDAVVTCLVKECGALVNAEDKDGWTSLHFAAVHRKCKCVRVLLALGAHLNVRRPTALSLALNWNNEESARVLLDYGFEYHRAGVVHEWVHLFVSGRTAARSASVALIRARPHGLDPNVTRIVAQWVWATRGETEAWGSPLKSKK